MEIFVAAGARAVGEVAKVLSESGGEGVSFRIEHQSLFAVLVEDLVYGRRTALGRQEEKPDGRRSRFRYAVAFLLPFVGFLVLAVLFLFNLRLGTKFVVDGFHNGIAQAKTSFSCVGTGRDEKVEVGIDVPLGVDAGDVRQAEITARESRMSISASASEPLASAIRSRKRGRRPLTEE